MIRTKQYFLISLLTVAGTVFAGKEEPNGKGRKRTLSSVSSTPSPRPNSVVLASPVNALAAVQQVYPECTEVNDFPVDTGDAIPAEFRGFEFPKGVVLSPQKTHIIGTCKVMKDVPNTPTTNSHSHASLQTIESTTYVNAARAFKSARSIKF